MYYLLNIYRDIVGIYVIRVWITVYYAQNDTIWIKSLNVIVPIFVAIFWLITNGGFKNVMR